MICQSLRAILGAMQTVRVECPAGRVLGNDRRESSVMEFLGIPFAQPPIGPRRFRRPLLLQKFQCIEVDARQRRSTYPWQPVDSIFEDDRENIWLPQGEPDEDCLHLNIWTPYNEGGLPVIVWIYGGGFNQGAATLPLYDGTFLAGEAKAVVVSLNYRLGPFGFLFLPEKDCGGNMGLWDQQCALSWLQSNISAFGGDPDRVVLMGESAGAASITAHLLCPDSWPLFSRVVLQSGVLTSPWSFLESSEAKRRSIALVESLGGWEAAMTASSSDILSHVTWPLGECTFPFVATMDKSFIPNTPLQLLQEGRVKRCPIMMGTVADEGSYYALSALVKRSGSEDTSDLCDPNIFCQVLSNSLPSFRGSILDIIVHEYFCWEEPSGETSRNGLTKALGDYLFNSDSYIWLRLLAAHGCTVLFYQVDHRPQNTSWPSWTGTKHGDEIAFVFGDPLRREPTAKYSDEERSLSRRVISLWTAFCSAR